MGLSADAAAFVTGVSNATGIDPRVLVAWIQAEGAYAPNGTKGYNFLNLRPYAASDVGVVGVTSGNFDQFGSVQSAVDSTVARLRQPFARPILQGAQAQVSPGQEIALIASTGWDSGHYGGSGGVKLRQIFASIFGAGGLTDKYQGPGTAAAVASTAGTGSAADKGSYDAGNAAHDTAAAAKAVVSPITAVADFLGKLTDPAFLLRAGEVVAGAVLVMVGGYLLAKQVGLSASIPTPVRAASAAVESAA
jgi:hypothetical protein